MGDDRLAVTLKVPKAQRKNVAAWERCAREAGLSRQAWCIAVLNAAAGVGTLEANLKRSRPRK